MQCLKVGLGTPKELVVGSTMEAGFPIITKGLSKLLPKSNNILPNRNIKDLEEAKKFAEKFGYNFPKDIKRISRSDKLTDMTIRGLMSRHNTFVRGVSTNFKQIENKP